MKIAQRQQFFAHFSAHLRPFHKIQNMNTPPPAPNSENYRVEYTSKEGKATKQNVPRIDILPFMREVGVDKVLSMYRLWNHQRVAKNSLKLFKKAATP